MQGSISEAKASTENTEAVVEHISNEDSVTREAIGGASVADLPKGYYRSYKFIGTFLSMGCAYSSALLGFVMVANVLPIINMDIGPSESITWVILVFVLTQTITFTLSGRLSDIFGRRYMFLVSNALAFVGYLVCSRAKSVPVLIGGSTIAGFGTGVQQTMPILFGELIPNEHRYMALGFCFAFWTPISAISPGLARVFVVQASWRWVYYMNAMFAGVSLVLQMFCYFPPRFHDLHTRLSKRKALLNLDYVGVIVFSGSLASLLLGISWGGQKYPWQSAEVISTITIGCVGSIAFVLWEAFAPLKEPLLPLYLFKNKNYVALTMVSGIGAMIFYALNIVWPQQIASVYQESVGVTGWMSCTIISGVLAGQILGSFSKYFFRFVSFKWQLLGTCILFTAFVGGLAAVTPDSKSRAIAFSILSSFMIGWMEVLTMAGAPLVIDPKDIGVANGIEFSIRGVLSALAASIYVTILSNRLSSNFANIVAPAVLEAGLPTESLPDLLQAIALGNMAAISELPGATVAVVEAAMSSAMRAFTNAYQLLYLVSLAFGGWTIIAAAVVNSKKMNEVLTSEIARKMHNVGEMQLESDDARGLDVEKKA